MKVYQITFALFVGLTAILCLTFGFKEKAEAEILRWSRTDEEPPKIVWYYDGETTHKYPLETLEPNDSLIWTDEVFLEITLREEPNFTGTNRIYLYKGDDFDIVIEKKEPNETILKIETEATDSWLEAVERWPDAQGYITDNFGKTLPLETNISEPNEQMKYSLLIPTWPDYIELEKDLIIDPKSIMGENWICLFKKGTKIYFKEDEMEEFISIEAPEELEIAICDKCPSTPNDGNIHICPGHEREDE